MPIESFVTTFFADWLNWTFFCWRSFCFVAARNRMRQQVADRSPQRHATLPTYYKILLRTEKVLLQCFPVLQSTPPYYSALQSVLRTTKCSSSTTLYYTALLCSTNYYSSTTLYYKLLLQYNSVLQSTTLYCSSTTLYYSVLLQYYSVLICTTPVLLCTTNYYSSTTKYYSSTTLYSKVLLQYYSVLQSTTPVLLCTTQCYSSTTLRYKVLLQYYKVLLQYYSVLQSTTPVLLCTTQCYSSTTPVLVSWLIRITYETLFTMRGTTEVLLQNHRLLRLPRKITPMIDPHHVWNVSYNARSKRDVSPTSPNTAPATQNDSHDQSSSHMKRYLQCAE